MRKHYFLIGAALIASLFLLLENSRTTAQKAIRWEYCAINATQTHYLSDGQQTIVATANICYLQPEGCRDEEVRAEIMSQKFIQEFRLENTSNSIQFVRERTRKAAFAKAVAKLGAEGWEMITAPTMELDATFQERVGYSFERSSVDLSPDVWFKRQRP